MYVVLSSWHVDEWPMTNRLRHSQLVRENSEDIKEIMRHIDGLLDILAGKFGEFTAVKEREPSRKTIRCMKCDYSPKHIAFAYAENASQKIGRDIRKGVDTTGAPLGYSHSDERGRCEGITGCKHVG